MGCVPCGRAGASSEGDVMSDGDSLEPPAVMPERWDNATREAAANAIGTLAGAIAKGPEGALLGATVSPYVLALLDRHWDRWRGAARNNAGLVLLLTSEQLDEST